MSASTQFFTTKDDSVLNFKNVFALKFNVHVCFLRFLDFEVKGELKQTVGNIHFL